MLGMQGSWVVAVWICRDLGLQVGNLQVLDVRTGSQTANAGDAGICDDWVANNKCWGCMQGSWAAGWQPAGVVAGCADWVANNKCWGCRGLGLQVGNLQVLWLDVRSGSQTTHAADAGILGCRLATCRCCGWMWGLNRKQHLLGMRGAWAAG